MNIKLRRSGMLWCRSAGLASMDFILFRPEDCIALLLLILVRVMVVAWDAWPKASQSNFLCC